jgi:hypothetical protein
MWCDNSVPDLLTIASKSKQKNHSTGFFPPRVALPEDAADPGRQVVLEPPKYVRTWLVLECDLRSFRSHIRILEMTSRFSQDCGHALIVMVGIVVK